MASPTIRCRLSTACVARLVGRLVLAITDTVDSNSAPVIRAAKGTDAEVLSALALRSKAYWGYSPEFMAACRGELSYDSHQIAAKDLYFAVCQVSDDLVGFYGIEQLADGQFELCDLFVEPRFIGQGYGRLLIENAKQKASELGAICLTVQGDPNAEGFYAAAGGVHIDQRESGSVPGRFLPLFRIDLT